MTELLHSVWEQRESCPHPFHDSYSAYSYGCCCAVARDQWRLYRKRLIEGRHKPQRVPTVGVVRRIEALCAIGWPMQLQGERIGYNRGNMCALRRHAYVLRGTAKKIDAMYRELSMTPGPSSYTRTKARNKGWAPPMAWDEDTIDDPNARPVGVSTGAPEPMPFARLDPVVVERAVAGTKPKMSSAEKAEAVRRLTAAGMTSTQIADHLGIWQRSVVRFRAQARAAELQEAS